MRPDKRKRPDKDKLELEKMLLELNDELDMAGVFCLCCYEKKVRRTRDL